MDSNKYTLQRCEKKFRGHDRLYAKYAPQIPADAEREYSRLARSYMRIMKEELESEIPNIKKYYKEQRAISKKRPDEGWHEDSTTDSLAIAVDQAFANIGNNTRQRLAKFDLKYRMIRMSNLTRQGAIREWKKAVKSTLAVNLRDDYYMGEVYEGIMNAWVVENVGLMETLPQRLIEEVKGRILDGFDRGLTTKEMVRDIRDAYDTSYRRAQLIASDQVGRLNAQITKEQQKDAGVTKYKWSSSGDERVRDCHADFDGQIFEWDNPPEIYYYTRHGIVYTGRYCHPGEDYLCRCVAIPVFERNSISLPLEDDDE